MPNMISMLRKFIRITDKLQENHTTIVVLTSKLTSMKIIIILENKLI